MIMQYAICNMQYYYSLKEETDQKKRKPFNYKYWETDTKYYEIPQQF